jgi:hypothetical protein
MRDDGAMNPEPTPLPVDPALAAYVERTIGKALGEALDNVRDQTREQRRKEGEQRHKRSTKSKR